MKRAADRQHRSSVGIQIIEISQGCCPDRGGKRGGDSGCTSEVGDHSNCPKPNPSRGRGDSDLGPQPQQPPIVVRVEVHGSPGGYYYPGDLGEPGSPFFLSITSDSSGGVG